MILDENDEPVFDARANAPAKATHYAFGAYYKTGVHGRVFMYIEGYWVKSAKTVADLARFERV